ncbi:heterokaryon incompatibility (het-6OR allele) [Fusarium subglutinans]|uniref:Heterokaryon incompatibility (Het-6OR allele) n=1 Tax=Gibberella subglutinans TaxID=42677 RepID=A0A8H5PEU5_GIBSU|nr:heterokaryon incompatibility (het-6OR allele) [Fusarium subglutinans]KAF5595289.1 heterokaryon incompatibility (het-6OR allele) [Fusarium subglutinans]
MPPNAPLSTPVPPQYRRNLYKREIRLALIYNGKWQDPISCVFKYAMIESNEPQSYSALSYVWGSSRATETIQIDGHDHDISINLACAIRHLRDERNSVLIWIDALCINQCDIGERSSQVAMMRDIYASAQHVTVFLGHGSYHRIPKNYVTDRLLAPVKFSNDHRDDSLITQFHNSWETMCRRAEWYSFCTICVIRALSDIDRYSATIKCIADGKPSSRLKLFELVRRFINSQWWQRVWVIQEATVTSQIFVQYGNVKVPWEVLTRSANICDSLGWGRQDTGSELFLGIEREHAKVLPVLSKQIFEIERLRMEWDDGKATTLLSLLQDFSSRRATDDRDKVFALLGLARDIKTIMPNYSLNTVQIYRDTIINLIKHSGSLTALSGDMKRKNSGGIPSWIPDWSVAMEEPDRRRMQLDGLYKNFPDWRIALIDREFDYWVAVTMDMHSLYREIESGKRRPIPKDIVDGLISYERILTKIYKSEPIDIEILDWPKIRAINQCESLYRQFQHDSWTFWCSISIETVIEAHLSLPLALSFGEGYRLDILRCCSMIYCRRALDFWLKRVQYLEIERYETSPLLISDEEKEEIVAEHCEHPTIEILTSRDAARKWVENMRRKFYTMAGHITDQASSSIKLEATDATVALEKDRILDVSMTFGYDQQTPANGGLLTQLSRLMRVASGVLSLWTVSDGAFEAVQHAKDACKDACKDLINLHRNKNISTTDHDYVALFSKAVVFMGPATWMRHLRDDGDGQPKVSLYEEHFVNFRREKKDEVSREGEDALPISSKFIDIVDQCTERLLTWVDPASRIFTISQWVVVAQKLTEPDFAVSFVRALVGDIYEESPGKFRRLGQPEIRLVQKWFLSYLLPQLCDMNPEVHGELWRKLLSEGVVFDADLDDMKLFDTEMRLTTEGRVFFITGDHRMGFGPASMVVGDEIRLLPGGNSPFVLRPVGRIGINSQPSYEVIGDCFFLLDSEEKDNGEDGLLQGCLPMEILSELLPTGYRSNDILLF